MGGGIKESGQGFDAEAVVDTPIDSLVGRDRLGKFILDNFSSAKSIGVVEFQKVRPIRPTLGDTSHLAFLNIVVSSSLMMAPSFVKNLYLLGKLVGYVSTQQALATLKIDLPEASDGGLRWSVLDQGAMMAVLKEGWLASGGGMLELVGVDKERRKIRFALEESVSSALSGIGSAFCFFEVGILCGQMEHIVGGRWEGFEKECVAKGDKRCLIELFEDSDGLGIRQPAVPHEAASSSLDQFFDIVMRQEKSLYRDSVKDFGHISLIQSFNYLVLSRSEEHRRFMKSAARGVGRRLVKKAGLKTAVSVLAYLQQLFKELKAGLLDVEYGPEKIVVSVEESVFCAGVANINMRLCIFLGGMIQGCLEEATGVSWTVAEEACVAAGDPVCCFVCTTKAPEDGKKLFMT